MTLYSKEEVEAILIFARDVLNSVRNGDGPVIPEGKMFIESRGVKVEICVENRDYTEIVHPQPDVSLAESIISAIEKIYEKIRGENIEMDDIKINMSIFSLPVEIDNFNDFKLGYEGLMCDYVGYKGMLFPTVEYKDKVRFLEALCREANISRDSWQNPNIKFYSFRAQEIGRIL